MKHAQPTWAFSIPVNGRKGIIRAFALVDPEDYDRLSQYRWHLATWGYVRRFTTRDGRQIGVALHRQILGLEPSDPRRVDHINRNPLDNRKANLRFATDAENMQNQGSRGGSSQYRGVTWDKTAKKWRAQAQLNGKGTTIGRFETEEQANAAAMAWRALHMPFSQEAA